MTKNLEINSRRKRCPLNRFPLLYLKDRSKNLADAGKRKYSQPQSSILSSKGSKMFTYIMKKEPSFDNAIQALNKWYCCPLWLSDLSFVY